MKAIKLSKLFEIFNRFGYQSEILNIDDGIDLLITNRGGRIYGPFIDGYSVLDWVPQEIEMEQCLRSRLWNIGGERIWLAPERIFNFEKQDSIIETYHVDPSLDPSSWSITSKKDAVNLKMNSKIPMTCGMGFVTIEVERSIEVIRSESELPCWRQSVFVRELSETGLPFVPWLIRQVSPGGTAFFSSNMRQLGNSIFGQPDPNAIQPKDDCWNVAFSGDGFFKVSYGRNSVGNGVCGYQVPDGKAIMYDQVLSEENRYPEVVYVAGEERPHQCAAIFYDSGQFGAYGEIEMYGHRQGESGVLEVSCYLSRTDLERNVMIR